MRASPPARPPDPAAAFAVDLVASLRAVFEQLDDAYRALSLRPPEPAPASHDTELYLRDGLHYVSPRPIIELLRDELRCTEFDATGQQDAHELLRFLLDKVNDCMQLQPPEPCPPPDNHEPASSPPPHSPAPADPAPQTAPATAVSAPHPAPPALAHHEQPDLDPVASQSYPPPSPPATTATPSDDPTTSHPSTCSPSRPNKRRRFQPDPDIPPAPACSADTLASKNFRKNRSPQPAPRKRYRRNLVPDLFEGRAVTATRCHECELQSNRDESFLDVSLPVEADRSLHWAMSTQCADEHLRGNNKYFCDNCHTYTEAKRWWQVASLPEVLTVHLKLFAYGERIPGMGAKVSVAMPCPTRLTLADWCTDHCPQRMHEYKLTAVIVHEGTGASSGHYYSYICKADADNEEQWFCCDDSNVALVSEDEVKERLFTSTKTRRTPYLLFYSNGNSTRLEAQS